jgi:hypothetical protein
MLLCEAGPDKRASLADINACATTPCNDGIDTAICNDLPAPALADADGRTCSCGTGFTYASENDGCRGMRLKWMSFPIYLQIDAAL